MLDIKFIREYPEKLKEALAKRYVDFDVAHLLATDASWRNKVQEVDGIRQHQNELSEKISLLKGSEKKAFIEESRALKEKLGHWESELNTLDKELQSLLYQLPNIPAEDVPVAKDESGNVVLREVGSKPKFSFTPRDYVVLGEKLDLIDTARAAKVSGARFGYLKHEAPLLEFALVQFVFSRLINIEWLRGVIEKAGIIISPKTYIPLVPPVMIRPGVFRAMGKLDFGQEEERYHLPKDDLYLVGSAEHTTGAMHMDEVLPEEKLPHRHIAFSTSFRREAGSYGKDTRGIFRVHQFDKLEMFSFAHPEKSQDEHDFFLAVQEAMMQELALPYRVMLICTGDMVWTDAKQYDIETWLPGQNGGKGEYRETHSASNSTDFQARRLHARFRDNKGIPRLLHTINGTAFAIGRTLIAILENYQREDGSVEIPQVLVPYMSGIKEIKR